MESVTILFIVVDVLSRMMHRTEDQGLVRGFELLGRKLGNTT